MKLKLLSTFLGLSLCLHLGANRTFAAPPKANTAAPGKVADDKSNRTDPAKNETKGENKTVNNETNEVAVIKTTEGEMVAEFWPDVAPETVKNFKKLAREGFYDGTAFHRVIKGFMIQGGDPLTKNAKDEARWGTGDPGYKIKAEFNDRSHKRGVLSMARSNDPDSAGSQFFICHGDPASLNGKYTTFGKLIKGDDVLEKIATTATHPPDRPDKRVGVESIKIVARDSVK